MVPNSRSFDSLNDAEPNIAVNPADPMKIAASAFTSISRDDSNAPIYFSIDGGQSWFLKKIIPGNRYPKGTGDITLRFNGKGDILYLALLRGMNLEFKIMSTPTSSIDQDGLPEDPAQELRSRRHVDQPYIQATTILGGDANRRDKVYVGNNDIFFDPASDPGVDPTNVATVDFLREFPLCGSPFPILIPVESEAIDNDRSPNRRDESAVRAVVHPSGIVYAVYYKITQRDFVPDVADKADVVIVRDDRWATCPPRFEDLKQTDTDRPIVGQTIASNVIVPYKNSYLGKNRLKASNLSIAVDPCHPDVVYVAWADSVDNSYTLHVRKSTDYGQSWPGPELFTIRSATNPALAVNTNGKVGFLYQEMIGAVGSNIWETHLIRLSDNNLPPTNNILSQFSENSVEFDPANEQVFLGDYLHLMAEGKDFYGVFSASNDPNPGNFPHQVTYQREKDDSHLYADPDHSRIVPFSIDPFFFHVIELDSSEDFYVRDFTNSLFDHDRGVEPSVDPHFVTRSDVWNRREDDPGGFNFFDQPLSEDPWQSVDGLNYAFVRIHRKEEGPQRTVLLNYYYSQFGSGSNFIDALPPDFDPFTSVSPRITFNPSETVKTPTSGYVWELPKTTSHHVCFAVEIATDEDPIIDPSLYGLTPGWDSGTDLITLNDNNKAQRNMDVYRWFWPVFFPPPIIIDSLHNEPGAENNTTTYAVVHNPGLSTTDLHFQMSNDSRNKIKPSVRVIGQEHYEVNDTSNVLTIRALKPGESRFLKIDYSFPIAKEHQDFSVVFDQTKNSVIVNGFGIIYGSGSAEEIAGQNIRYSCVVYDRVNALYKGMDTARMIRERDLNVLEKKLTPEEYTNHLSQTFPLTRSVVHQLIELNQSDPFELKSYLGRLQSSLQKKDLAQIGNAHLSLLNSIDAFLTSLQLERGNIADILQTIYVQRNILKKIDAKQADSSVKRLVAKSNWFIDQFGKRKISIRDYPSQLRNMLSALKECAIKFARSNSDLSKPLQLMQQKTDPAELQGAHIKFLLLLNDLVRNK